MEHGQQRHRSVQQVAIARQLEVFQPKAQLTESFIALNSTTMVLHRQYQLCRLREGAQKRESRGAFGPFHSVRRSPTNRCASRVR